MNHWTANLSDLTSESQFTQLKDIAASFKLLADETRLRVLSLLMHHGELNVRTLCEQLDQSQPAVSHHLALLRDAGLIRARRDGKHNYYRCVRERLNSFVDLPWSSALAPAAEMSSFIVSR